MVIYEKRYRDMILHTYILTLINVKLPPRLFLSFFLPWFKGKLYRLDKYIANHGPNIYIDTKPKMSTFHKIDQ
jgi:hypothetical protein